jgi:anti-sigma B factor antagonist
MQLSVEKIGDLAVVTVHLEELDAAHADAFKQEMMTAMGDCRHVVLDLASVRFMDSRGCGAILSILKHLSVNGGDLKLCQVSKSVRTLFDLIRMHRICEILTTREEAIQAFGV